ncbi:putative restriction endonuclease [Actinocorallia herbida]|uniref:Putative restriction endonuclease n=1 Tax=Actinocorallia herbida TaxID=58109 RepID=A0A3N1CNK1_9ACTN|nr:Uma2 family endonuclease [Actinocorallia herbida]ROO82872.1 putative restriction endonuclease [Actinocorallia herbida]
MVLHSLLRREPRGLLRRPPAAPTAEAVRRELRLPKGRTARISGGRLRIDGGWNARWIAARLIADLPAAVRVEQYGEEIVIAGAPSRAHDRMVEAVADRIAPAAKEREWAVRRDTTVLLPSGGAYVRPDLVCVRPGSVWQGDVVLGADLAVAVEVAAAPDAADDRELKRRFYATAGVSCYVLLDLERGDAVLYDIPCEGDYHHQTDAPLGTALPLPFDAVLDTAIPEAPYRPGM